MLIGASGAVINPNVIISAARGETPGEPQSHPCYLDGKYHQSTTATRSTHRQADDNDKQQRIYLPDTNFLVHNLHLIIIN